MFSEDHQSDIPNPANDVEADDDIQKNSDDQDEQEEILSLCDLPIYEDSFIWEEEFSVDHSSTTDDLFEFFTEAATKNPNNNNAVTDIVFCGKIIPYRGNQYNLISPTVSRQRPNYQRPKNDNHHSLARSKSGKPRWYLYAFGMMRFPATEMELRGMTTWQSRRRGRLRTGSRSSSCMFPSFDDDDDCETTKEKVSSGRSTGVKRFWGLLRTLGRRCLLD